MVHTPLDKQNACRIFSNFFNVYLRICCKYLRIQMMLIQNYGTFSRFFLRNAPSTLSGFNTRLKMLCLWGFCMATDPDDNVKKLCEVFWVTTEWRKDVNIPLINIRKKSVFVTANFSAWKMIMCKWNYLQLDIFPFIFFNRTFSFLKSSKFAAYISWYRFKVHLTTLLLCFIDLSH